MSSTPSRSPLKPGRLRPEPVDSLARNSWTASLGTGGRLRPNRHTSPEMRVRRLVPGMGYRYRLHAKELRGRPDLVFRPRRKAIFVHGCFWHRHAGCSANRIPKTRADYWRAKLNRNVARDRRNEAALRASGWSVLVIWECETRGNPEELARRITAFLG